MYIQSNRVPTTEFRIMAAPVALDIVGKALLPGSHSKSADVPPPLPPPAEPPDDHSDGEEAQEAPLPSSSSKALSKGDSEPLPSSIKVSARQ